MRNPKKTRNNGRWTEARHTQFIRSALRAAFRKWPPKFEVLRNALTTVKLNIKTGRMAKHYRCAGCGKEFPMKEVQVDHIDPVVDPVQGFVDWDTFIERLYCEAEGLQVLCKAECHQEKSKSERAARSTKKESAWKPSKTKKAKPKYNRKPAANSGSSSTPSST